MDDEYVIRRVKPQAVVGMPLSLKRWVEEQARERETSQAAIIVEAILEKKARMEAGAAIDETEAVPA